jgi:uncharacterized protein
MHIQKLAFSLAILLPHALAQTGIDPKILEKANAGDAFAEEYLALSYDLGRGVEQDHTLAASWFKKAADQGNTAAAVYLGSDYESGTGVPQDYAQAAFWYKKAAQGDNPWGQRNLAVLYMNGQGVPKDLTMAAEWLQKAATLGFSDAQYRLGGLYHLGMGVPQNYAEAYFWFDLALAGNLSDEARKSAESMKGEAQHHMSNEMVLKVQERATIWFSEHPTKKHDGDPTLVVEPASK